MNLWAEFVPDFISPLESVATNGRWLDPVVFTVLFCALVDFVKLVIELLGRDDVRESATDASLVTAVIACRNGEHVLPGTIAELRRIVPHEHILVVDDGSTDATSEVARTLGCDVYRFEHSKGKAAAVNYAVHRARTPLTLLLDDDTRIGGLRLPTSLIMQDGFDAVAFHVLPDRRNRDGAKGHNFLGEVQRYEYGKSMEIGKRFHDVTQSVSCVSGAIGLFRTRDLHDLHHEHTGVFQGEDLQRTIVHLLHRKRIVFANQPVWTVAPSTWRAWFRQRLGGWYPGLYHQFPNMMRLMLWRHSSWRLRYEMVYNLYTLLSDPLKVWSLGVILAVPGMRWWGVVVYVTYLVFESFAWWSVRQPGERHRASVLVLLFYPLYGAMNTILRFAAFFAWLWMRFKTGSMRPRRGPLDRMAT